MNPKDFTEMWKGMGGASDIKWSSTVSTTVTRARFKLAGEDPPCYVWVKQEEVSRVESESDGTFTFYLANEIDVNVESTVEGIDDFWGLTKKEATP